MVCGMAEDPCIEYLEAGAVGFSSGMANFVPRMSLELLRAFRAGETAAAARLRAEMIPFEDLRGEDSARVQLLRPSRCHGVRRSVWGPR